VRHEDPDHGQQQGQRTIAQHVARPFSLRAIFFIYELTIPTAQRYSENVDTMLLERQDFTPDEGVADFRILIDEIGDPHDASLVLNQRRLAAQHATPKELDLSQGLGKAPQ